VGREGFDPRLAYGVLEPSALKEDEGPSIASRITVGLGIWRVGGVAGGGRFWFSGG